MAKKQFLDQTGLEELAKHIPILVEGDNVTLTPDSTKPNKITISSDIAPQYVGATSSDNATSGMVPAATSAEKDKFLKGDGTWNEVLTSDETFIKNDATGQRISRTDSKANIDNMSHDGTSLTIGSSKTFSEDGHSYGILRLQGRCADDGNSYTATFANASTKPALTANQTYYLPDKTGYLALTSDPTDVVVKSPSTDPQTIKASTTTTKLALGGSDSKGILQLTCPNTESADSKTHTVSIIPSTEMTAGRSMTLPSKSGTLALTSDLPAANNFTLTMNTTNVDSEYSSFSWKGYGNLCIVSGTIRIKKQTAAWTWLNLCTLSVNAVDRARCVSIRSGGQTGMVQIEKDSNIIKIQAWDGTALDANCDVSFSLVFIKS